MDWTNVSAELRKDLDKRHVQPPKQYGPKGHYIEAWFAQAEANRIFGHDGWHQEVTETRCVMERERPIGAKKVPGWGVTYTAKVRILVDGVCREDFGAGHGYDLDLGLAHESAIKEAVSDAMKRTLKSFGWPFGLALYDKTKAHVGSGEPAPQQTPPAADKPPLRSFQTLWDALTTTPDDALAKFYPSNKDHIDVLPPHEWQQLSDEVERRTALAKKRAAA